MKLIAVTVLLAIIAYASAETYTPREYYGFIQDAHDGDKFEIERPDDLTNAASCYENGSGTYSTISCTRKCQERKHWGGYCRNDVCICQL